MLLSAIEAGGSTLRDYARPDGELGYFSKQFRVYGREGEACPCGGVVRRRVDSRALDLPLPGLPALSAVCALTNPRGFRKGPPSRCGPARAAIPF